MDQSEKTNDAKATRTPSLTGEHPHPPPRIHSLGQVGPADAPFSVGKRARRSAVFCRPSDSLATVLRLLARHHLDWLPVVSGAGMLVGTISVDDIERCIASLSLPQDQVIPAASAGGET
jgi:CBS domain